MSELSKEQGNMASKRKWLIPAATVLVVFLVGLLALPKAPRLSASTAGDQSLAQRARSLAGDPRGYQSLLVVEATPTSVTSAGLGELGTQPGQPTMSTRFQLGSITKTFTGLLLAEAMERGEVRLEQPVADLIPELAGTDAGASTLVELATHRSGLPSILPTAGSRALFHPLTLRDPYATMTTESLIADLKDFKISSRGSTQYSNTGVSLLGIALTRAAKAESYPELVTERVFAPLGMTNTTFCPRADELPADGATGYNLSGRRPEPWCSEGQLPAGASTWTTAEDLTKYAQALLTNKAPGMKALDPAYGDKPESKRGLLWVVTAEPERPVITWHNGAVAGASTYLGLDRAAGKAVVVLGNSDRRVESIGVGLLEGETTPLDWQSEAENNRQFLGLAVLLMTGVFLVTLIRRALKAGTRTQLVASAFDTATSLLLLFIFSPWVSVPWITLPVMIALWAGAIALAAGRWREIPWTRDGKVGGWIASGFSFLALAVLLMIMAIA